ncbi:MAG TPA: hypothetical protein VEQ65_02255, partial [Opitutus sp.]|nr:hypothetical protein [Opitutus sp.]
MFSFLLISRSRLVRTTRACVRLVPGTVLLFGAALLFAVASKAQDSESMADRGLRQLVEQQRELLASAAKAGENFDEQNFRMQVEQLCRGYEELLRANPKMAAGYAAYGYLLSKV